LGKLEDDERFADETVGHVVLIVVSDLFDDPEDVRVFDRHSFGLSRSRVLQQLGSVKR
jgi:hypothetical protein